MLIQFEMEQVIALPPGDVFAFLSQPANMSLWNYYVLSAVIKGDTTIGVGTVFDMRRKKDQLTYRITEYSPPHKLTIALQPPGPAHQLQFELMPEGPHTHLTYRWQVALDKYSVLKFLPDGSVKDLLLSIPRRFILRLVKPATEENFHKLKTLLETGDVILQDGRYAKLD